MSYYAKPSLYTATFAGASPPIPPTIMGAETCECTPKMRAKHLKRNTHCPYEVQRAVKEISVGLGGRRKESRRDVLPLELGNGASRPKNQSPALGGSDHILPHPNIFREMVPSPLASPKGARKGLRKTWNAILNAFADIATALRFSG